LEKGPCGRFAERAGEDFWGFLLGWHKSIWSENNA
jgi:hypothetical protein